MTLVEPKYLDEIIGRLREGGHDVRHFALLADRDTVLRRLRERSFGRVLQRAAGHAPLRRESFAVANLDRCLTRLGAPEFAEQLWTDRLTIAQIADHIATSAGLTLSPNTDGALASATLTNSAGALRVRVS